MLDDAETPGLGDLSAIRGASARAMAEWITAGGGDRCYPGDAGDFARCEALLEQVPALRARLGDMAGANAYWAALVPEWPALRAMDAEACSAAIRAIIRPIEALDPGCGDLGVAVIRAGGPITWSHDEYLAAWAAKWGRAPMKESMEDRAVSDRAYRVSADELRQFIERYERLEAEKKEVADLQKEVMAEAKGRGYDTRVMRKIIALRKRKPDEVAEEEAVLELYKAALGMAT